MEKNLKPILVDIVINQNIRGGVLEFYRESIEFYISEDTYKIMKIPAFGDQLDNKNSNLVKYLDALIYAGLGEECTPNHKRDLPTIEIFVYECDVSYVDGEEQFMIDDIIACSCLELVGVADSLNIEGKTVNCETDTVGLFERFEKAINSLFDDFRIVPIPRVDGQSNNAEAA